MSNTDRRRFLQGGVGGLAAAACVFPAGRVKADNTSKSVAGFEGVRLAIATICCDGFGNHDFEPTFKLLPKIGFKNVEFNCWYPQTLTPEGVQNIVERSKSIGVNPICVQGNSFQDGSAVDVAHKLWCMETAKQIGCRRVKFTGAKRGTNGGLQSIIDTLKELTPAAEAMDLVVCVENHAGNNLENIDDYEQIFSAIDSRHVGMCLDTGHFDGAGVDIDEVIRRFHQRVVHVDLKDCKTRGAYQTVRFGEGITDLHGSIQALIGHGYNGYLVVEQAPPIVPETLELDLRRAYEMFRKYEQV